MKIVNETFLIREGKFAESQEFAQIMTEISDAVSKVTWHSKEEFIINPTKKGNGVVPIKLDFIKTLLEYKWVGEYRMALANGMKPGPLDAVKETSFGKFAVEWETGNISSSHRALNKIAVGIIQGQIIGGILILPVRELSTYLTDRIGNYEEIAPYFVLYQNLQISEGVIGAISIVHDNLSSDSPLIPKGNDGNAIKESEGEI